MFSFYSWFIWASSVGWVVVFGTGASVSVDTEWDPSAENG
jgi:hypothetical protein